MDDNEESPILILSTKDFLSAIDNKLFIIMICASIVTGVSVAQFVIEVSRL